MEDQKYDNHSKQNAYVYNIKGTCKNNKNQLTKKITLNLFSFLTNKSGYINGEFHEK